MSNDYFDNTQNRITNGTTARSPDVNNVIDAVSAGFDLLPSPENLWADTASVGVTGGTVNAITLTIGGSTPIPYIDGQGVVFLKLSGDNTGACTLAVDAGSPKPLVSFNGAALIASDLVTGRWYQARFSTLDDEWRIVNDVTTGQLDAAVTAAETAETNALNYASSASAASLAAFQEAGYAEEWAQAIEDTPVSVAAGGDGITDFSALHWAAKGSASAAAAAAAVVNGFATNGTDISEQLGGIVVSTGDSGALSAPTGADDLIVEGSGDAGITVLCPDLNLATVKLGTPTDSGGAHFKWDYTNLTASVGSTTVGGQTALLYNNGTQGAKVDSTGRLIIGDIDSDALGVDAGSVTISTGNSTAGAAGSVDCDDLIIESAGNTGIQLYSSAAGFGQIHFGDVDDDAVGAINYSHSVDGMSLKAGSAVMIRLDGANGNVLLGDNTTDRLGAEFGSVTISTGDALASLITPHPDADDLIIEGSGHTGISIYSGTNMGGAIRFGSSAGSTLGALIYDHALGLLQFRAAGVTKMNLGPAGRLALGDSEECIAVEGGTPTFQVNQNGATCADMGVAQWSATANTNIGIISMARSNSDTVGTFTAVENGDILGMLRWQGSDSVEFQTGCEIRAIAKGTWTTISNPTQMGFRITLDGESATSILMRLTEVGQVKTGYDYGDLMGAEHGSLTVATGNSTAASVSANADDIVIESDGNVGMSLCSPNTAVGQIRYVDPENSNACALKYDHSTNNFSIVNNAGETFWIKNDGSISVTGSTNYETLVTDDDDIPNKKYVDDKYSWLLVAEESVALDTTTNGGYQWSFGNGETSLLGPAMPVAGEVTHLTLSEDAGTAITATVQLVKNGTPVAGATIALSAAASGVQVLATPVTFAAGDKITFVTSAGTAQGAGAQVTALCRAT